MVDTDLEARIWLESKEKGFVWENTESAAKLVARLATEDMKKYEAKILLFRQKIRRVPSLLKEFDEFFNIKSKLADAINDNS